MEKSTTLTQKDLKRSSSTLDSLDSTKTLSTTKLQKKVRVLNLTLESELEDREREEGEISSEEEPVRCDFPGSHPKVFLFRPVADPDDDSVERFDDCLIEVVISPSYTEARKLYEESYEYHNPYDTKHGIHPENACPADDVKECKARHYKVHHTYARERSKYGVIHW